MKTIFAMLLLAALAPCAFADADLAVDVLTPGGDRATAGTEYVLDIQLRNLGAETAPDARFTISGESAWMFRRESATGVQCAPGAARNVLHCRAGNLAPGEAAHAIVSVISTEERVLELTVSATSTAPDSNPQNNTRKLSVLVAKTTQRNDLTLRAPLEVAVKRGEAGVLRVEIATRGSSQSNVRLAARHAPPRDEYEIITTDPEVECRADALICTIPFLRRDVPAVFEIRTKPRDRDDALQFVLEVFGQDNLDLATHNNTATSVVHVGDPNDWRRILVPLPAEATMFIRAENGEEIDVRPSPCEFAVSECIGAWRTNERLDVSMPRAQFFYVRAKDAHKVKLRARIGDTELPIPRDEDFTTGTASLLGIPNDGDIQLHIYDANAHDGGLARIHIYRDEDTTPVLSSGRGVRAMADVKTTPARLPLFPAIGIVDVRLALYSRGFYGKRMRIDIEPIDEGMRLWSFVTVTNEKTGQVTVISQQ